MIDGRRWPAALLVLTLLLSLALRLAPWGQNRFLEDEALYSYWALQIATGADPMLDDEPVDKPPLHPYVLALAFVLLGPGETPARLPSLLASVAGLALVYALGRALYADAWAGLLAAILLALSPFDLLFASTAFTDPLMVAWVLGALLAAARGRPGTAGLLAGLAGATKQQGLFFLPLVAAIAALRLQGGLPGTARQRAPGGLAQQRRLGRRQLPPASADAGLDANPRPGTSLQLGEPVRMAFVHWRGANPGLRFAGGLASIGLGVAGWDLARTQRPGFLSQSLISYGGLGPAQPQALVPRALAWLQLLLSFWGAGMAALLAAVLLFRFLVARIPSRLQPAATCRHVDTLLAGFLALFLVLHWAVGFQVWDRYLLGLVALAALLAARLLAGTIRLAPGGRWRAVAAAGLGIILLAVLGQPVAHATHSRLPLGGDHGAYDGIDQLAAYLRAEAPAGAVLYHYWLGSHYRFYLHGAPLRLHWYPDAADLARDATIYRREPRYIAFPSFRNGSEAQDALAGAGIELLPAYETRRRDGTVSFRLYKLQGPD